MKLDADDIVLTYGERKVLQSISISVQTGEIIGLCGRNGSGKSSLLKVIYGMLSATTGSVRVDGLYVKQAYKTRNLIGFLPQANFIPSSIKIGEAFSMYGADLEISQKYFPELPEMLNQPFGKLSGGQARVCETLVVVTSPTQFLFLDEPFSNIAPLYVERLKPLILALKKEKGMILTDHYYRDVLEISNKLYHLDQSGRLMLLNDPIRQLEELHYIPPGQTSSATTS